MQLLTQTHQQQGMVTMVISLMLMLIISIVIIFVAKSSTVEQRISANQFGAKQAFAAAQAGLQFGIPYLAANRTTIVRDTNTDGYIDSYSDANTSTGTYTITYTNPQANNLDLIQVQSVGTSSNGLTTRTVRQLVQNYNSGMPHPGNVGLVAKNIVTLSGNVAVTNTVTNQTIHSGGIITSSGSVDMTTTSGTTSDPYNAASGATMNNTNLQNATSDQLFQNFFGTNMATMQARADLSYSGSANYSTTLNGVTGKIIYINGDADFSSNATIGSAAQPVIIIVNGIVNMSANINVYGFVYSSQNMNLSGGVTFRGVVAGAGNFSVSGNVDVIYDATVVNSLSSNWQSYAPVAGSWRDF